jgi:hypothetical protein
MVKLKSFIIFVKLKSKYIMKYKTFTPRFFVALSVIIVAALLRLLPHWPNLTPIAAMALFAGTYIDKKQYAFAIPLAAMVASDLVIGLHANILAVYAGFSITVLIGMAIRKRVNVGSVVVASLISAVVFFLITNFSSWLVDRLYPHPMYPQTFAGLLECYGMGLAFFRDFTQGISFFLNDFIGTLFYSAVFYGAFYLTEMRFPVLDKTRL